MRDAFVIGYYARLSVRASGWPPFELVFHSTRQWILRNSRTQIPYGVYGVTLERIATWRKNVLSAENPGGNA